SRRISSALIHHLQNEGAPPPREEPWPDRAQPRVGRQQERWEGVDRSRDEIPERPAPFKEGGRPFPREQRRLKEPASPPASLPETPKAQASFKQGRGAPGQPGPTENARDHRRLPTAPPRQELRHPAPSPNPAGRPSKKSRATPADKTRLYMNVGEEMNIASEDVVNAILGETGLPRHVVGNVALRERHLFVDVA